MLSSRRKPSKGITASRRTKVSRCLMRWIWERSTRTVSTTDSIATPKCWPRTMTVTMRVTVMVRGSCTVTQVPAPTRLVSHTSPPALRTAERTTSMPTPRPAISVSDSAVEKPGS